MLCKQEENDGKTRPLLFDDFDCRDRSFFSGYVYRCRDWCKRCNWKSISGNRSNRKCIALCCPNFFLGDAHHWFDVYFKKDNGGEKYCCISSTKGKISNDFVFDCHCNVYIILIICGCDYVYNGINYDTAMRGMCRNGGFLWE